MIESNTRKELEQQIEDYVNGKLSPSEVDELWAELIQDEYYMDYMKSVANLKKIAKNQSRQRSNVIPLFKSRNSWFAMAAAAVVLIVGSFALFDIVTDTNQVQPVSSIELDYYRSSDLETGRNLDVIREVIVMANNGNVEQAMNLLDSEIQNEEDPDVRAELLITKGSISYNSGDYNSAIQSFETAVDENVSDKLILEKAYWYLGNSHFQQNNMDQALVAFQNAHELNGAYSRITESYLKALNTTD
jgi:tetratricopeptide (TPR) repeat protein